MWQYNFDTMKSTKSMGVENLTPNGSTTIRRSRHMLSCLIALTSISCNTTTIGILPRETASISSKPSVASAASISDIKVAKIFPERNAHVVVLTLTISGSDLASHTLSASAFTTASGDPPATTSKPVPLAAPNSTSLVQLGKILRFTETAPSKFIATIEARWPYSETSYGSADAALTLSLNAPGRAPSPTPIRFHIPPPPPPTFNHR